MFIHAVCCVGYSPLPCGLGREGPGIICCYICAINPERFILTCSVLFFSQKQFQLSLRILLCFHSRIISANQLSAWARYDASVGDGVGESGEEPVFIGGTEFSLTSGEDREYPKRCFVA